MKTLFADVLSRFGSLRRQAVAGAARRAAHRFDTPEFESLEIRSLLTGSPIVAVLNTGLNVTDPAIIGHVWINPNESSATGTSATGAAVGIDHDLNGFPNDVNGWNFTTANATTGVAGDNNIADTDLTFNGVGDGTFVAATVLDNARIVGNGTTDVLIMPVKVLTTFLPQLDSTNITTLINGINYVVREKTIFHQNVVAMVINMMDYQALSETADGAVNSLRAAVTNATDNGIILSVMSGNDGANNDLAHNYPANFTNSLLLSVAAVDINGTLNTASNYSPTLVDLAAFSQGNTAPAAGAVAGAVAGLASQSPGSSPQAIVNAILTSVIPDPSLTGKVATGGYLSGSRAFSFLTNHAPIGVLESVGQTGAFGYAYDIDNLQSTTYSLAVDGVNVVTNANTTISRPELGLAGNHGFSVSYPALTAGTHTLSLYVNNYPAGTSTLVASKTVNITVAQALLSLNGNKVSNNQTVDFGDVFQGSTSDAVFQINNTGTQTLSVGALSVPAGYTVVKDISHSIAAGGADTFILRINSTTTGIIAGDLTFTTSDAANSSYRVYLTGAVGTGFINNLYTTLLGRGADAVGLSFWTNQLITHQQSAAQIATAFLNSTEYRTNQIVNLYTTLLGRSADQGGLNAWLGYFNAGGTIEGIRTSFLASDEYFTINHFSASETVAAFYNVLLNRPVDQQGGTYFTNLLVTGTSRTDVANQLQFSAEGRGATVERLFQTYLGRGADAAGISFWSAQRANGAGELQVAANLLASAEFFLRP